MTGYYIGIDIGGTFTDCAVLDEAGRIAAIAKSPTTRDDPARGVAIGRPGPWNVYGLVEEMVVREFRCPSRADLIGVKVRRAAE